MVMLHSHLTLICHERTLPKTGNCWFLVSCSELVSPVFFLHIQVYQMSRWISFFFLETLVLHLIAIPWASNTAIQRTLASPPRSWITSHGNISCQKLLLQASFIGGSTYEHRASNILKFMPKPDRLAKHTKWLDENSSSRNESGTSFIYNHFHGIRPCWTSHSGARVGFRQLIATIQDGCR